MFRSLGRCRTGILVLAGALAATGLSAREVRGLRSSNDIGLGAVTSPSLPVGIEDIQAPSLDLQLELLYGRLKNVAGEGAEYRDAFTQFGEALKAGSVDDAAIWTCIAAIPDAAIQDKYDGVMRDFAQRVLLGEPGFPVQELPMEVRPAAWRVGIPDGSEFAPKALCNTCTTPSGLAAPTTTCQFIAGNTTSACPSDFYSVTLTAGVTYQFTMCGATCSGASATWDTRIRVRQSGTCTILVDNDDFCGLQSQAQYTPATTGTYIIEVTGYTASYFGSYTMGYRQMPTASACGSCASPIATLTPSTTCQSVSGSNSTCPSASYGAETSNGVWYNVNLIAGRTYTFSTCPNNAAGGTCYGTATYDTRLDLWNSTCTTLMASNDDVTCATGFIFRSALAYTPTTSGTYKMQVRGYGPGYTGNYTMAYQELSGCPAPSVTSSTPTSGSVSTTSCSTTQTFQVDMSTLSAPPFNVNWTITPPVGGSATPASGTITGTTSRTITFSSTLTKPRCGTSSFTVSATIVSTCNPGAPTTRTWTYTLSDTTAPNFSSCPASVTLDCAAPTPARPTLTATDNCDSAPTVTVSETTIAGNCPGNRILRRQWTARDCNNNTRTCTQDINFVDRTPPTLSGVDARCLYPPNHEYYCFQASELTPTVSDDCSLPVSIAVIGGVSNEPDNGTGDGDFPNDIIVSPDGKEICVRSERAGSENDRVYVILGVAIDACGNRSAPTPVATITVPHDDSEHPECLAPNGGLDKHF